MKKKKWLLRITVIIAVILLAAAPAIVKKAIAALNMDYELAPGNDLSFSITQNKASSSATIKYSTVAWYLFPQPIGAATSDQINTDNYPNYSGTINASFYNSAGVSVQSATRTRTEDSTYYYDTYTFSPEEVISIAYKWINQGLLTRDSLSSVTLYVSRPLAILKNNVSIGTVYSYPEMERFSEANDINWSGMSWRTFYSSSYDQEITLALKDTGFSIDYRFTDSKGNVISASAAPSHSGATGFTYGNVYYGEPISVTYPGDITGYKYIGWEFTAGNFEKVGSGTVANYTADYKDIGNNSLTLTFKYEKVEEEIPFQSPTPEPTQAPDATATPTPTPTAVPTPAPTSQPTVGSDSYTNYNRSYSTDAGYYMGKFLDSSTYYLANYASAEGFSMNSCTYVSRTNSYSIGTDSSGNTWYFVADGTNATYVHPAKYNGYSVESTDIQYITELVFPSTVTYGGTTYTVTSIGGGTAKYKTYNSGYTDTTNTSGYGTYTSYDYYKEYGGYYYTYSYAPDSATDAWQSFNIDYQYGVIGNGQITSYGYVQKYYYTTYVSDYSHKENNYYFYNTTLKKVTIPDTVTEILPYAFYHCQALETIEGGNGITTIGMHAFEAWKTPVIFLSSSGKYFYYNDSYSAAAYTDVMLAFREKCFLSDKMTFPYLPALKVLGYMSFAYHYNISDVDLSETVTTIYSAFVDCELDNIRIPNVSVVIKTKASSTDDDVNILGTKGYSLDGDTTRIHCEPDSTAMAYGLKYDGNYVLYCGYPVTYEPNGADGTAQEVYSALNINYGYIEDGGIRLSYQNYKSSSSNQYYYSSSTYQYESYLDPEGGLWRLDTTNKTMEEVSPGTTFTDLYEVGAAHFAYDSDGNLWVSGQQCEYYTYTDSSGDECFYARYSSQVAWRKMTLPTGTVKTQLTDRGVFALDSNGVIWWCKISSNTNIRITSSSCTVVFTDFCFITYRYDADYGLDSYLAALDADGNLYRTNYYYSSNDYNYPAFNLENIYASGWNTLEDDDFRVSATGGGVQVAIVQSSSYYASMPYVVVLTETGTLEYYYQYNTSNCTTYTDYVFTEMEPYSVMGQNGLKLKDSSGNTYLACTGSSYNKLKFTKVASSGVEIKETWYDSSYFFVSSTSYGGDYYEDGGYYQPRMYVWTDDGYLTVYSGQTKWYDPDEGRTWDSTYQSNTSWKAASVKFTKIYKNSYFIFGIAEDGTLWSGGDNTEGQLGHASTGDYSYGYDEPSLNCSKYLLKTGDRTYTDVYFSNPSTVYALGTDSVIYRSGYYYAVGVGSSTRNSFDVAEVQSWPGNITRFIKGYDYNTVLVSNPFAYEGYSFTGWNTASDGSGTSYFPGDAVELSSALTVYAQWSRANNVVRYDRNGGSGTMPDTILAYDVTSTTLAKNVFSRTGYTFTGWNTEADGTGTPYADEAVISGLSGIVTVYAQWKELVTSYTLNYMKYPYGTANNTVWKSKTLSYAEVETIEGQPFIPSESTITYNINTPSGMSSTPDALSKTSETTVAEDFNKWRLHTKNSSGSYGYAGIQYVPGTTVSMLTKEDGGVVYLYPAWTAGSNVVVLPYTEAEGYVLEGWSESSDGSSGIYDVYPPEDEENIGTFTAVMSTTLYAIWEPLTKTVTLNATNIAAEAAGMTASVTNSQNKVTITYDAVAPAVSVPSCERWVFMGYYTALDSTGNPTSDSLKVYDTNRNADGTVSTTVEGCIVMNNVNGTFDDVDILYAYWVPDKAVNYDANGGTGTMDTSWMDTDKDYLDLPANAFTPPTGYHFAYWCQTAAGCTGESASGHTHWADKGRVTGITGRITLYAQWAPNNYTVTLEPEGGEQTPAPTVKSTYDSNMPSITIPKRSYLVTFDANGGTVSPGSRTAEYTFGGYYTGMEGTGTQYYKADGTSARTWNIAQDTTLYAKWTSVSVTLPTPERTGYIFRGWYSQASGGDLIGMAGDAYTPEMDVTLYAQWEAKEYDIVLDDRGATGTTHTRTVHMIFDAKGTAVTVPTKTGYTFHGYYTGTRGTGTKYYDAGGICVKAWTEDDKDTLYAFWTQDEVILPDAGDRTEPVPLPETEVEGSIGRTDARALLYADDYDASTGALTDLQPYLTYDTPASEGVIPGTEALAFRAKMGAWMLDYKFRRCTGTDYVRYYVTVPYRTQYERSADEKLVISEQQTKTYTFLVPKTWSYWEVVDSSIYYPEKVVVYNDAFKEGQITVAVNVEESDARTVPSCEVISYGEKKNHVGWLEYDSDGIPVLYLHLTEEQYLISDVPDTLPDIDASLSILCGNEAWKDTRQASVKSDRYSFGGQVLLSDSVSSDGIGAELWVDKVPDSAEEIEMTSYQQTYVSGIELEERKANGTYKTRAVIIYREAASENGTGGTVKEVVPEDINDITIHTPVVCEGVVVDGMEREADRYVLVLREALNFFTLRVDNTGTHRMSLGYGTKDFAIALSGKSNVAMEGDLCLNQVSFPFDVYVDVGNDSFTSEDYLLEAGNWLTVGREEQQFFLPVTAENGIYTVQFRTIAVNCPVDADGEYQGLGGAAKGANTDEESYVAADVLELEIKSYLKAFNITGTDDMAADKQLQAGSQALTLKKGYGFSFMLLSQGEFYEETAEIEIVPSYYWESEDGTERQEVKLYHMKELLYEEGKECCAWEEIPLLVRGKTYEVILQQWTGTGMVPADVLCVAAEDAAFLEDYAAVQTITGKEACFKKSGFLVIRLEIRVKSNKGVWYVFDNWGVTELAADALQAEWNYIPGDIIRYDLSKSIADDYEVGGVE